MPNTENHNPNQRELSELHQSFSRRAVLTNAQQSVDAIQNLSCVERAELLNRESQKANRTVHEDLEQRFMEGDNIIIRGDRYALYIHEELDLAGVYAYDTDRLIVLGSYREVKKTWYALLQ